MSRPSPLLPQLRGRLPASASATLERTNLSFIKKPLFRIYSLSTLVPGLGFFFSAMYLPSYAAFIGIGATKGALLLAIMCIAQVLGQFAFGYVSDGNRWSVSLLAVICSVVASGATFTLWGFAKSRWIFWSCSACCTASSATALVQCVLPWAEV